MFIGFLFDQARLNGRCLTIKKTKMWIWNIELTKNFIPPMSKTLFPLGKMYRKPRFIFDEKNN